MTIGEAVQYFEPADEARARVVAGVALVERELARTTRPADDGLTASWAALVKLLAVEAPQQTRRCPHCQAVGMRAATRCGRCWKVQAPLAAVPAEAAVAAGGLSDF
jgi:hypothetical protein